MALSSSDAANFAMAVKQARPDITDTDLAALVKEAGDVNDDPAKSAALAEKITPQAQAQSSVNTQLASPYKGAGYDKAALMRQFSPEQLQAAYADQQRMYQSSLPSRAIGGILAGGSGSGDVMTANKNAWEGIDKQNMLQSIEKQKALQSQATEGLAAGTVAQTQDKTAGEYQLSQAKGAQDLAQAVQKTTGGQLDLASKQRLNDPNSNESLTAKAFLKDQIEAGGMTMPTGINSATLTAQQIINMGILEPKALEALKTKVGITATRTTTGKTVAETDAERIKNANMMADAKAYARQQGLPDPFPNYIPGGSTSQGPTPTPTVNAGSNTSPAFNFKPGTDLRVMRNAMASQPPNVLAAFDKKYPGVATATGPMQVPTSDSLSLGETTVTPTSITPQTVGKPIMNSINANNMDPSYIANAKLADLSPVQQLMRKRMESTDNSEVVDLDRQIAAATGKPLTPPGAGLQMIKTPTGTGTYSTSVSPVSTAAMDAAGKRIQAKADSIDTFNATGRQAAQNTIKLAPLAGYDKVSNTFTGTDEDAKRLQLSVDRLNAEAERLGLVVSGSNTGAAAVGGAAAGALGKLSPMLGAAAGAFSGLLSQTSPLSNKTPPEVLKQFGYMTQLVAERQKALLSKENAWAMSHNGDTSGFLQSPDYKYIMNTEPYVNPKTGDLVLPMTRSQQDDYLKQKYGPLSHMSFTSASTTPAQPSNGWD